jgi:hypothetical protein
MTQTRTHRALKKLAPIAINIAKILGWVLFLSLLAVAWLGFFTHWVIMLSPTSTIVLCVLALLPIILIYQYYAALHNLISLPQRLTELKQDSVTISPQSIEEVSFNGFNILKYIWILKTSLDDAKEFITDYIDLSILVSPLMLTLLAMALFSCLALWLNVVLTVILSFFIF